jgi:hypothetical protein
MMSAKIGSALFRCSIATSIKGEAGHIYSLAPDHNFN